MCVRVCEALPLQIWWDTCAQITACSDDRGSSSVRRGNDASACQKKSRHMGPRRRKTRSLKWFSRLAEDHGFVCSKLSLRVALFDLLLFSFFRSPVRRRWWSAKLKTPWPTWSEGWCPTDIITTTTITTARAASRTACRLGSLTVGRNFWTSPRSSCSTPPNTHRGRCSPWREAAGFHGKQATQSECRYPLNRTQAF